MWIRFLLIPFAVSLTYFLDSLLLKSIVILGFSLLFFFLQKGGRCCGLTLRERIEQNRLLSACKSGDVNTVTQFIKQKGIKEVKKIRGPVRTNNSQQDCSILFFAIYSQNIQLIDHLVSQGFDPNELTNQGETPLMRACVYKATQVVHYFTSHQKLDLEARHFLLKKTALVLAYERGFHQIVDILLRAGARVEEAELIKREPPKHLQELRIILAFHRKLRLFLKLKKIRTNNPAEWPSELEQIKALEINKLARFYL